MKTRSFFVYFLLPIILFLSYAGQAQNSKKVVIVPIREEIAPSATRLVAKALHYARENKADLVAIDMDTYGGLVTDADSIRFAILSSPIPVIVFINPNAASAGALISIACDKIYMKQGANIGAATVVNQNGEAAPDKFQSYMRGIIRATAEAKGIDTILNGDTIWVRNPNIAEAMVDQDIEITGVTEKGKVITLTPQEAIRLGFCDGIVENLDEAIREYGIIEYESVVIQKNMIDVIFGFFKNPAVSGILILLILGGIYYELQSPGLGFPIVVSIVAAFLYFVPNFIDGLAANWEILLFIIGIILLGIEIFAIPGFGIFGVSGIILVLFSLVSSLIANDGFDFTIQNTSQIRIAFQIITFSVLAFLTLLVLASQGFHKLTFIKKASLETTLERNSQKNTPVNKIENTIAICFTDLKPYGKIIIDNNIHNAMSINGYASKGDKVLLLHKEFDNWHCKIL